MNENGIYTISQLIEHNGGDGGLEFMKPPHMKKLNEILKLLKVSIQKLEFIDSDRDKITMYRFDNDMVYVLINGIFKHLVNKGMIVNEYTWGKGGQLMEGYAGKVQTENDKYKFVIRDEPYTAFELGGSKSEKDELRTILLDFCLPV